MSYYPNNYLDYEEGMGSMPSRYLCDVLEDMRKMHKTRNYSGLMGSIEQAQVMASRMEAALGDKRTIEEYDKEAGDLNRDLKKSRRELRELNKEIQVLQEEKKQKEKELKSVRHEWNKETKNGTLVQKIEDGMDLDKDERQY